MRTDLLHVSDLAVVLDHDPRLIFIDISIGLVSECHNLTHRFRIFTAFIMPGNTLGGVRKFGKQFRVWQGIRQLPIETFADEAGATTGNVNELANQVRIYARYKVIKIEIDIFNSGT